MEFFVRANPRLECQYVGAFGFSAIIRQPHAFVDDTISVCLFLTTYNEDIAQTSCDQQNLRLHQLPLPSRLRKVFAVVNAAASTPLHIIFTTHAFTSPLPTTDYSSQSARDPWVILDYTHGLGNIFTIQTRITARNAMTNSLHVRISLGWP